MKIIVCAYVPSTIKTRYKELMIKYLSIIKKDKVLNDIFSFYFVYNLSSGKTTEYRTLDTNEVYYTDFYDNQDYGSLNNNLCYSILSFYKYIQSLNIKEDFYIVKTSFHSLFNYKKLLLWLYDKPRKQFLSALSENNLIYSNNYIISNDLMDVLCDKFEKSIIINLLQTDNSSEQGCVIRFLMHTLNINIYAMKMIEYDHNKITYHTNNINDDMYCFVFLWFDDVYSNIHKTLFNGNDDYNIIFKEASVTKNIPILKFSDYEEKKIMTIHRENVYKKRNMSIFMVGRILGYEINKFYMEKLIDSLNKQNIKPYFFISLNNDRDDYHIEFEKYISEISDGNCVFNYEIFTLPDELKTHYETMYNTMSMHYNNTRCLNMITEYIKNNNISFDVVMKWRTEFRFDTFNDIHSTLIDNVLNIPVINNHGGINDQIAYGNYNTMVEYANFYYNALKYTKSPKHAEKLFGAYVKDKFIVKNFIFLYDLIKE
jgi:hypothetical protein